MTRSDWHLLALAVLASPVLVTGWGLAISRGYAPATAAATVVLGTLVVYLARHRIRVHLCAVDTPRPGEARSASVNEASKRKSADIR
ncbi:hypothetical protein [Jidongwangia harbinensis]|uniref:hypothetical protein n=1 Tax=Jidongwangia harbinensis TaxID=2878561 RepID=UPI001CD997B7|nr:hypothetical protein [Jidongwangia harbinensis]MCA2219024.1 hypothetical protein [Jidongwangia harbinensis]